jgi:uncharacterized sulfatase
MIAIQQTASICLLDSYPLNSDPLKSENPVFKQGAPWRFMLFAALVMSFVGLRLEANERPNILWFIADDHGRDEYSFRGHPDVQTPAVDALAQQGMVLHQAAAPTAMCAPSRSAMYTGLWPQRNGCYMNHGATHKKVRSLPHYLKPLGYEVVLTGKQHIKPKSVYPFTHVPFKGQGHEAIFNWDALKKVMRKQQPFCLIAASNQPHRPYSTSRHDPQAIQLPEHLPDTPLARELWAGYLGDCERADKELEYLLRLLDETGQRQNTIVIYTSDHGHGTFGKWTCYQRGLNVITIIAWPQKIQPGNSDALISLIDILPTIMELVGGQVPLDIDGKSFAGLLNGNTAQHRDFLFGQHTNRGTLNGSAFPIRHGQ